MARSHDMTSGSIWRSLLGFSIPIMISNLVQSTYNAVDMLFVGRFTGTESLAAVSVCGPILNVMIITLSGMSAGVLVVISGLLGAGDIKQAQDAAHTSVALYALMAAVMTVLGLLFVPQILRLVQTPAAAMPEAKRYLYTVFAGTVFTFGYNLIGALQRGLGNAAASMPFVIISSAANIALYVVFIVWLGMGAVGAALGTVLSQVAAFVIGTVQFARGGAALRLSARAVRFHKKHLKNILLFGVPTALNEVMVNLAMLTVSGVANSFGLASSAAYGVGSRINSLAIFTDGAMNQTMSAYASQNIGAGRQKRALEGLWKAIILSAGAALGTSLLVLGFASEFSACFDSDPAVIEQSAAFCALRCVLPAVCHGRPAHRVHPRHGKCGGEPFGGGRRAVVLPRSGVVPVLPVDGVPGRRGGCSGGAAGQRFHLSLVYPHAPLAQRAGACCKAVRRGNAAAEKMKARAQTDRRKRQRSKKKRPEKKLAVAKPCIFAQQSASHAANAAKRWSPFHLK